MKRKLLIALTATLLSGASFSQLNAYFLNNPVWRISSACVLPQNDQCVQNELYNYYLAGDTMINALVYKKVFRKGQGSYSPKIPGSMVNCPGVYNFIDSIPSYFLRSSGKQMFVKKVNEPAESLLYDFNLNVGDTLPQTYNSWETDITVTAIDSILTTDSYRKRYTLSNNTNVNYLIEGIGHSNGLFEPIGPIFDCGYSLQCFSMNDNSYFPLNGSTCEIAVGIRTNDKPTALKVFPNPLISKATIEFSFISNRAQLHIYNRYGQRIRTLSDVSGDHVDIMRESLPSGLYIFEIVGPDLNGTTGKLLIVD